MGNVVLNHTRTVRATADELFASFGRSSAAGWLFSAECDRVVPGAIVSMEFPLESAGEPGGVRILGRFTKVVPSREIVLSHDQPWAGRTRIAFEAVDRASTAVSVRVELDDQGVEWLTRRLGLMSSGGAGEGVHRVGLLTSKTGPGAIFAVACENLARLAVEEINDDGGLGGRPVELLIGDDGTDPQVGVREARRLIDARCRVVVASVTSATFDAVQRELSHRGVGLVHAVLNEGGAAGGTVLRWGERPSGQLDAAVRPFMAEAGARDWFLIGNDYSWSHGAHSAARRILPAGGGRVAGERLVRHGTADFSESIDQILSSGAECVLSTLVGADEVAFERQAFAAGLRERAKTLSLVLDESTHERIGVEASRGLWAVSGYFESLDTGVNRDFVARYRQRFGRWAPPISSFSEGVYEALQLYANAVRAGADSPVDSVRAMLHAAASSPRGLVRTQGPEQLSQAMYLAKSSGEALEIFAAR
ncbi:MAG: substrate-binding protein [Aeromicrobium sp.]